MNVLTGKKLATDAMTIKACCCVCRLAELLTHLTNDSILIDSEKTRNQCFKSEAQVSYDKANKDKMNE